MRRAKIVCTIGPATASAEQIQNLVDAGMDVARINRSHGAPDEHELVFHNVRAAAATANRPVAILVDLQGPKIRLGKFEKDEKYWLDQPGAPKPKLENEKPKGETVDYDKLIEAWKAGKVK